MLKGNTKIELTNIHTGKKEIIEKHNTFTNAISKLLEYYTATSNSIYYRSSNHPFLPLSTVGLSGIYLSSEILDEKTTIVDPRTIVGYAGYKVDTSGSKYMGSLNSNESKKLDNGYQYVWDFGTDRANGIISAVGLTSGTSNVVSNSNNFPYNLVQNVQTGRYIINLPWVGQCIDCTEFGKKFMFATLTTPTTVKFTQIQITYGIVTLNDTPIYKIIKEETVTIPDLNITLANYYYDSTCCYISFDVANKFYYLITPNKYIRFNANTLNYDASFGVKSMPSNLLYKESSVSYAGVINGYMYKYKTYDLYRWKVDSPESNSKYLELSSSDKTPLNSVGNYFISGNRLLDPEEKKVYTINNNYSDIGYNPALVYPVASSDNTNIFLGAYNDNVGNNNLDSFRGYSSAQTHKYVPKCDTWYYPYFATINNLVEPVTKTSDKAMKITYTVTEE